MSLHSFSGDLSYRILELYSQIDRQTSEFQSKTGLQCPPGCGQCCESSVAQATVLELLPAAEELFSRGEAQQWLGCIASIRNNERCVFYYPDPLIPGNGRCELYLLRPSVCRLFGFAVMKNKDGKPELITCRARKRRILFLSKQHKRQFRGECVYQVSITFFFSLQPSNNRSQGRGCLLTKLFSSP